MRHTRLYGAVLAVLVLLALGYYAFFDPYSSRVTKLRVGDLVSAASTPADIAKARYLLSPNNGGGIYADGRLTYADYALDQSIVIDVVREGEAEAKVRYEPLTFTREVVINGARAFSTTLDIRHLVLAPDGSRAAFAVREAGASTILPQSWSVRVVNAASGAEDRIEGFAAVFLDSETLLVFRAGGAYLRDAASGEETQVSAVPFEAAFESLSLDRGSSRIAWITPFGRAFVYDVIRGASTALLPIAEVAGARGSVTLTKENLYVLAPTEDGGAKLLGREVFAEGDLVTIRSFGSAVGVTKLLP